MVKIKDNMVILDNPTKEIHIAIRDKPTKIMSVKQDELNRTYIMVGAEHRERT